MGAEAELAAGDGVEVEEGGDEGREGGEGGTVAVLECVRVVEEDDLSGGDEGLGGEVGADAHARRPAAPAVANASSPSCCCSSLFFFFV